MCKRERNRNRKEVGERERERQIKYTITSLCALQQHPLDPLLLVFLVVGILQNIGFNALAYTQASRNIQVPSLEEAVSSNTVSFNRLDLLHPLHYMQLSGTRPQEWVWGHFGGLWWVLIPPLMHLTWMSRVDMASPRWGFFTTDPVCVREDGCYFPLPRGCATPSKTLPLTPLGCKGVCATWPQANELVGCGLPSPWIQPELDKTAAGFGFPVDTFSSLSLIYLSLDLR